MMRWLMLLIVADLLIAISLLSGAASSPRADLVFISGSEHRYLDPQRVSWLHDIRIVECLFDPLVRTQLPQMAIEPSAADHWTMSEDGLHYTFHLRPDAHWSNGDPLRASDFVYAWRRALMPDLAADYTQLLWCIEGARQFFKWRSDQLKRYLQSDVHNLESAQRLLDEAYLRFEQTVGVLAVDEKTLVVHLARPTPYFLGLCAFATFMPVHADSVDRQVSLNVDTGMLIQDPYWIKPDRLICSGPYVLAARRFKRDLLLNRNPYYWNRQVMANDSILERIVGYPQTQLLMYEGGEVDWLPDIPSSTSLAADLATQNRADVHIIPAAGTYFYNFNCQPTRSDGTPNPLADRRVRRALSLAMDRQTIVTRITRLGQPPARTFVPLGALPQYEPPVEAGVSFDPEGARKLLASAGYPGGRGLEGLSILYNNGFGHEVIAQALKHGWQQHLGVAVSLQGLEVTVFGERLKNHDFTIARAGWFGDYLDPTTYLDKFVTGNGNNDAAYSNPAFDRLMEQAANELNPAKRMAILREAEVVMLSDQPIAPIYQYVKMHVFDPDRVAGVHPNPWNFRRLEQIRVRRASAPDADHRARTR